MEGLGWDYNRAHTFVQSRRYCISLNEGFKRQLKEYEPIFQARRMPMTGGVVSPGTLKRPMEEDEDDTEGVFFIPLLGIFCGSNLHAKETTR